MTFVFQDSVDMPIQRNFVDDLEIFLDLIEKILPLEDKIIELDNLIKNEDDRNKKDISILEDYYNEFNKVLDEVSNQYTRTLLDGGELIISLVAISSIY